MKKKIPFYVLLVAIIVWIFCVLPKDTNIKNIAKYKLEVNGKNIPLIVSDTEASRVAGLSGRASLVKGSAMLFVFDEPDTYGFWMKDMKFPIDIIWLDENNKIVYIEKSVSIDSYPEQFFPPEKSLYVIEANAGFSDENKLEVGNILKLTKG
jgi:uncharacterized membrane protein (UPF0127 family)